MIGHSSLFPPFLLLWETHSCYWCNTNMFAVALCFLSEGPSAPILFFVPFLVPFILLSWIFILNLHFLCRHIRLVNLVASFFHVLFSLCSFTATHLCCWADLFSAEAAGLVFTECSPCHPVFLGQWDVLREKVFPSIHFYCAQKATCVKR